jgi:hypothetical protein
VVGLAAYAADETLLLEHSQIITHVTIRHLQLLFLMKIMIALRRRHLQAF